MLPAPPGSRSPLLSLVRSRRGEQCRVITVIAQHRPEGEPPAGVFFFDRAERDLGRGDHPGDVLGIVGTFAGLGQQPGDVEIRLMCAWSWTSRSTVAKLAGSRAKRSSHSASRSVRIWPVRAATSAGGVVVRPPRDARLPLRWQFGRGGLLRIQVHFHRRPPPGETRSLLLLAKNSPLC